MSNFFNIDKICMKVVYSKSLSQQDAEELEKEVNKALGILIEDGLFAFSVWLESKKKKGNNVYSLIEEILLKVLKNIPFNKQTLENKNLKDFILEISDSLEKVLFIRKILERALIYLRYRAKALGE